MKNLWIMLAAAVLARALFDRLSDRDPWAAYGALASGFVATILLVGATVLLWGWRRLRAPKTGQLPRLPRATQD